MSKKQIPLNVIHEPKSMAWSQLTPLSEHKQRESDGIKPEIIPDGTSKSPLPISRATTELRRAYPYIFDCVSYALTHNPEKVEYDFFYARFTMPYEVFLDYCMDYCTEQTQYLKEELYALLSGKPAKYIKVSETRTVYAQPVIIALSHDDPKGGKAKSIRNIKQDKVVTRIQIQVIKELLTYEHGYLNKPKALYAKIRCLYNAMMENARPIIEANGDYRKSIDAIKKKVTGGTITTEHAVILFNDQYPLIKSLEKLEQGGFHKIFLALEYILTNKKRGAKEQCYDFLKLCEKCAPEYTQEKNGKLYFKDIDTVYRYKNLLYAFVSMLPIKLKKEDVATLGIESIDFIDLKTVYLSKAEMVRDITVHFLSCNRQFLTQKIDKGIS